MCAREIFTCIIVGFAMLSCMLSFQLSVLSCVTEIK